MIMNSILKSKIKLINIQTMLIYCQYYVFNVKNYVKFYLNTVQKFKNWIMLVTVFFQKIKGAILWPVTNIIIFPMK